MKIGGIKFIPYSLFNTKKLSPKKIPAKNVFEFKILFREKTMDGGG